MLASLFRGGIGGIIIGLLLFPLLLIIDVLLFLVKRV